MAIAQGLHGIGVTESHHVVRVSSPHADSPVWFGHPTAVQLDVRTEYLAANQARFLARYPARVSGRISSWRSGQDIWPEMRTYRQTNGTKNANLEKNWRRVASGNACFKRTFDPNELSIQTHDSNELSIQTNVPNELSIQTEIQTNFRFKRTFDSNGFLCHGFALRKKGAVAGWGPTASVTWPLSRHPEAQERDSPHHNNST